MERRRVYDHEEFSQPIGGWVGREDRPTPERTDKAFRIVAAVVGIALAAGVVGYLAAATEATSTATGTATAFGIGALLGGLAYGFVRATGLIVVAAVGAAIDGPEWSVSWRIVRHDLGLSATWALLIEAALFLCAAGMMVYSLLDAVNHRSAYSAAVFVLLVALTWWPFIRRWIQGHTPARR